MLLLIEILMLLGAMGYFWHICLLKWQENLLAALADLDAELRKKHAALLGVAATVRPLMAEEDASLIDAVTQQLTKAGAWVGKNAPRDVITHFREEARLDDLTQRLLMRAVDYPRLNADSTMLQRRADYDMAFKNSVLAQENYNAAASELNKGIQLFPGPLIARYTKVAVYPFFETEKTAAP